MGRRRGRARVDRGRRGAVDGTRWSPSRPRTATPFTNTLPVRRLGLRPGETADLPVAWVIVPGLRVERARQRYTCLRLEAQGAVYLYENLDNGFRADLPVDADGMGLDYPDQFRRREPRRERG